MISFSVAGEFGGMQMKTARKSYSMTVKTSLNSEKKGLLFITFVPLPSKVKGSISIKSGRNALPKKISLCQLKRLKSTIPEDAWHTKSTTEFS